MNYLAKISGKEYNITLQNSGEMLEVSVEGEATPVELIRIGGTNTYLFLMNNQSYEFEININESGYLVHYGGKSYKCFIEDERQALLKRSIKTNAPSIAINEINSPMPGLVVAIEVEVGQKVKAGQGIIIIEAMKMENEIKATVDAIIKAIMVKPGQVVEMNQMLVVFEA